MLRLYFFWLIIGILLSSTIQLYSAACRKRTETCWTNDDCCVGMGRRLVCAPHQEICGLKKVCCITEVEEQQEKQAALRRKTKAKRFRL